MMRYRWSIWYLLPGSPVFWKPPSQTKWRSQRCHKLCIRKLSHTSRTIIKLSETVMPEGAFSSGALNYMQYQRLNSAQFYPVLFLFAIFPKLLLVQMQQGDLWKGWRKQQEKQGGEFHTGESGPANSDMSQHYRVSGLILDQTISDHSTCGLQHYASHCWVCPQFPCQTRCWILWHSWWVQLDTAFKILLLIFF